VPARCLFGSAASAEDPREARFLTKPSTPCRPVEAHACGIWELSIEAIIAMLKGLMGTPGARTWDPLIKSLMFAAQFQ